MHLFHKWMTIEKGRGVAERTLWGRDGEESCVIELQRCMVCEKERAKVSTVDGTVRYMDPLFVEGLK